MENNLKTELFGNFKNSKLMQLFGAEISNIKDDYFEIRVPQKDFMMRSAGMFNGATMATLVDVSSYASALTKSNTHYYATVELKINYLSPAIGDNLIAKAEVIKRGKVLTVVRSDIYVAKQGAETLVATSLVTLMQLKNENYRNQIH
jgi:uncharacterized protein (TIGR00369 family)